MAPYNLMAATSTGLDTIRQRARDILNSGWKPTVPDSPTHADLAQRARTAARSALASA